MVGEMIKTLDSAADDVERELLRQKILNSDSLYDPDDYQMLRKTALFTEDGNKAVFKAFTYKDSLRFSILLYTSPNTELADWLADEIAGYRQNQSKSATLLWYSQVNGFSGMLPERLPHTNPDRFYLMRLVKDRIEPPIDLKDLEKHRCTEEMLDDCIDVMEEAFTPFPDKPGSFRADRARIAAEYLPDQGNIDVFYKDSELVGLCGHIRGQITEMCVRPVFQGRGYGEAIARAALQSIAEAGYDAELTVGAYNERAIALYRKVGFETVYESVRVNLR